MDFPFYDAPNTAVIICFHAMNGEEPILFVSHDEDDGMWQFLCEKAHETEDARIVSLKFAFELDNSIGNLVEMPCGYYATRENSSANWVIRKR